MARTRHTPRDESDPLDLGRAAAAAIPAGEWHLDAPPDDFPPEPEPEPEPPPETPTARPPATIPLRGFGVLPSSTDAPPSPERLIEAMLFVGGHPLTEAVACTAVRGLTREQFRGAVDSLNARYRRQSRPYSVHPRDGGYVLALLPAFRGLREKLYGGPREARLSQPALDVLAVVAYQQPVSKAGVDAVRGTDSGGVLRQLVRLGLVAVRHRAEAGGREVRYGTTPRFLEVFGVASIDDLPRLGDTQQV